MVGRGNSATTPANFLVGSGSKVTPPTLVDGKLLARSDRLEISLTFHTPIALTLPAYLQEA
jgi:hypothetical protein